MKQFRTIFQFEFLSYLKNKVFISITIGMIIAMGLLLSIPRIVTLFDSNDKGQPSGTVSSILLVDEVATDTNTTLQLFGEAMPHKHFLLSGQSIEELKQSVSQEEYESAIVITQPNQYTHIVKSISMGDHSTNLIDQVMLEYAQATQMTQAGVSAQVTNEILNTTIISDTINIGKDQTENFLYTYILVFALYMAILLYGQMVSTSVASEKSSRAMELLITSAKPSNLIFGKVMGTGLAGILQFVSIFGSASIFFNLNKSYWVGNMSIDSIFNIPLPILLYAIMFFILGFFLYCFLYGAVGSLASKVEDINTSTLPINLIFIVAFMIVITSMSSGDVDSTLMVVASYIPFTSPMAMFARISMGEVATIEVVISVAILIISTGVIGYISAKIYKIGVLLYGKPPKILEVLKALK